MFGNRLQGAYKRWLPLALGVTALANLVISLFVPLRGQPLLFHQSGSLTHLVHTDASAVDLRYGLYMELGELARGGTLIVPPDSPIDADLAEGLSGMTVEIREYDPTTALSHAPSTGSVGVFETDVGDVSYWILPGDGSGIWWLTADVDEMVIAPQSMVTQPGSTR